MKCVVIALLAALIPLPAMADFAADQRAVLTAEMHHRQQAAVYGSAVLFAQGVADCVQTSTRISHFGAHENNPLTPQIVIERFHKDRPGLCIDGWAVFSGAWYLVTHKMGAPVQVLPNFVEGVNLLSQTRSGR